MGGKLQLAVLCVIYILLCESETTSKDNRNGISRKCSKCPPAWGTGRKCTKCVQCKNGKSYSAHYSSRSRCWPCSKCGVGLFESHKCSPTRDTICSECVAYLDQKNLTRSSEFLDKCGYLFLR